MRDEKQLLQELNGDLQLASRVLYLEGKSDVALFFALLGIEAPRTSIYEGVLVRGLSGDGKGSGAHAVRRRVELGAAHKPGGVFGVIDGDGADRATLAASFDPPFAGPCFSWKAYCIENLLVETGWPPVWGEEPDWTQVLREHAPYVALNRLRREVSQILETLRLARFVNPQKDQPLETAAEVVAALKRDRGQLLGFDAALRFTQELGAIEAAIQGSQENGHALVNGKWLVDAYVSRSQGASWDAQRCRDVWIAHAISVGGHPEVRALWRRITAPSP